MGFKQSMLPFKYSFYIAHVLIFHHKIPTNHYKFAQIVSLTMSNYKPAPLQWRIDPAIDIERMSLDDLKLFFSQAEKRLDDTVKTGESIASKTMSMLTLMAGLLITLSGYLISNWKNVPEMTHKDCVALLGAVYLFFICLYTIKNVLPNEYHVLGSEPSDMITPNFFDPAVNVNHIPKFIYISEIENYDYRIEVNLVVNKARWKRYKGTVVALVALPILLGIVYALLEWLLPVAVTAVHCCSSTIGITTIGFL